MLRQALELYDVYQDTIRRCDAEIEGKLRDLQADSQVPDALPAVSPRSGRSANEPDFDLRSPLFALCGGVDLSELPGIAPYGALKLVSEIGLDMGRFASEKHFTAWLTLSPRTEITGGKVLRSHTQPSANRAAKLLRMAAMSLGRSDHALGAFYRRLAARVGKAKAITATARKLAILVYRMLRDRVSYREVSATEYDQTQRARILRGLRRRAASLGLELVDTQTGLVM